MKCRDLMHLDLQWVAGTASVREAARQMRDDAMGFLLVHGAQGALAGVVTDRDLATRVCTEDRLAKDIQVIDVASRDVVVCGEDEELKDAEKKMREEQKSRLVVVNAAGKVVGILSLTNILLGDRPGRAIATARGVLAREAEGPHTPVEQIKLTPSTAEDEDAVARQETVMVGRSVPGSVKSIKMFP
jgi:signal-transduction protein with cAMP-binding, CBS, and nucleotidyltransferase domain